jgi:hypothetical protein
MDEVAITLKINALSFDNRASIDPMQYLDINQLLSLAAELETIVY